MSRAATAERFGENGVGGSWYDPPLPMTTEGTERYRERAAWLQARYPNASTQRLGIAGTGFGWTQFWLFTDFQRQSWGCDVAWAQQKASIILGAWASFVGAYDVLVPSQMTSFRRMGMTGQARYPVLFTEDLLPAANNDAEVQVMLTNLQAVGVQLVHLITPRDPATSQTPDMLWHTMAEWRTLIGPNDIIVGPDLVEIP